MAPETPSSARRGSSRRCGWSRGLDGAEVELALIGAVFGDVGQPQLVGPVCGELTVDEVVVNRWAGFLGEAWFLANTDQMRSWEHNRATRFSPAVIPRPGDFIGDEAVAECGVVGVNVEGRVDQVDVVPVTL